VHASEWVAIDQKHRSGTVRSIGNVDAILMESDAVTAWGGGARSPFCYRLDMRSPMPTEVVRRSCE